MHQFVGDFYGDNYATTDFGWGGKGDEELGGEREIRDVLDDDAWEDIDREELEENTVLPHTLEDSDDESLDNFEGPG